MKILISVPLSEYVFLIKSSNSNGFGTFYFRPLIGVCISNREYEKSLYEKDLDFRPLIGVCISNQWD